MPTLPPNPKLARGAVSNTSAPIPTGASSVQTSFFAGSVVNTASAALEQDVKNFVAEVRKAGTKDVHGTAYIANLISAYKPGAGPGSNVYNYAWSIPTIRQILKGYPSLTKQENKVAVDQLVPVEISGNTQPTNMQAVHTARGYKAPTGGSTTFTPEMQQGTWSSPPTQFPMSSDPASPRPGR